jgi:hypothetical protein
MMVLEGKARGSYVSTRGVKSLSLQPEHYVVVIGLLWAPRGGGPGGICGDFPHCVQNLQISIQKNLKTC